MNDWIWLITAGAIIIAGVLFIKVLLLKKSAREIRSAFAEKINSPTNTLIHISSHDKDMRELASSINAELQVFHETRHRFEHGDLELKEAIMNISHDLRTPLTAIYGYIKLLKKEKLSGKGQFYLLSVEDRTKALKQLTEELFQYTIASGDPEGLVLSKVCLNGVLEKSISSYYVVLTQHNITPRITIPDQKVERRVNENALFRVIGNIISNAVKYSDGDLGISLSTDGMLTFSNHAAGLTEVQVGRLFDRFYTVSGARRSTGLGLSIAKILTEKMGGTITASYVDNVLTICIKFSV